MKPLTCVGAFLAAVTVALAVQTARAAAPASPQSAATLDKAAMEEAVLASEQALNDAVAKGNLSAFRALVVDGAWSVNGDGRMSALDFEKDFSTVRVAPGWTITESRVVWIDSNSAVVTYRWTGNGTMAGQPRPSPVFASTVWTLRNRKWVAVFHQETTALPGK